MKRFNIRTGFYDENKTVDSFIEEVIKVFEKYNLTLLIDKNPPYNVVVIRVILDLIERVKRADYCIYDEKETENEK